MSGSPTPPTRRSGRCASSAEGPQVNGTVDLLVAGAVKAVGGRVSLVPWVMFAVSAVLVGIGALFAVAIVAPIALRFAARHRIDPLYMGLVVVHGALGGAAVLGPLLAWAVFVLPGWG